MKLQCKSCHKRFNSKRANYGAYGNSYWVPSCPYCDGAVESVTNQPRRYRRMIDIPVDVLREMIVNREEYR